MLTSNSHLLSHRPPALGYFWSPQ